MSKTILVTGGGRGIGRGISIALAKEGYNVIINYAGNKESASETLLLCEQHALYNTQIFSIAQGDISKEEERQRLIEASFSLTGTLDGIINNAGIAPKERKDLLEMSPQSYDTLMEVNLRGPLFLTQAIAHRWEKGSELQDKTIIFVSSISSNTVSPSRGEYCISKAGLSMVASLFASRLAKDGARVYEIRPGIIKTDMTSTVESKYDNLLSQGLVPQMRWGSPSDIGKAVSSLLRDDFAFSTGSVFYVDGGLHIPRL